MPRSKAAPSGRGGEDWELHRREIFRLFVIEEAPVAQVANYMANTYGFSKEPKDYEYRLKKWGFRRNLHGRELQSIVAQLSERERAGRQSEVIISGRRWPRSRLVTRLERHKSLGLSGGEFQSTEIPDFVSRIQTPSPLLSDLPEWPKALPWLQFSESFRKVLACSRTETPSRTVAKSQTPGGHFLDLMQCYIEQGTDVNRLHPQRRIIAVLGLIAPQIHEGDHEISAEILHTGSRDSLTLELLRLVIYLATNHMLDRISDITGCDIDFYNPRHLMGFLRQSGALTKANIDALARSATLTNEAFLEYLLGLSLLNQENCDVLSWLVPCHFDVNLCVAMPLSLADISKRLKNNPVMTARTSMQLRRCTGTLLQACSIAANPHAVRFLLDLGSDPFEKAGSTCTSALEFVAASSSHSRAMDIVELMLSPRVATASPETRQIALQDALWPAIASSNIELIRRFISEQSPTHPGIGPGERLHAARFADCDTMRLLSTYASLGDEGSIQEVLFSDIFRNSLRLDSCTWSSDLDRLQMLLDLAKGSARQRGENGCKCSCYVERAILKIPLGFYGEPLPLLPVENRILDLVNLLRKNGYPLEREKVTSRQESWPSPLQRAIQQDLPQVVEYLLDWGADINYYGNRSEGKSTLCRLCGWAFKGISGKVSKQPSDIQGSSPLLTALAHQRPHLAKMLLSREPNLRLYEDEYAIARGFNDTELLAMILRACGDKVNRRDCWELLSEAIMRRCAKIVNLIFSMDISSQLSIDSAIVLEAVSSGDLDIAFQIESMCGYNSRAVYQAVRQSRSSTKYHHYVDRLLKIRHPAPNDDFEVLAVATAASHRDRHMLQVLIRALAPEPWTSRCELKTSEDGILQHQVNYYKADGVAVCDLKHIFHIAADIDRFDEDKTTTLALLDAHIPAIGMTLEYDNDLSPHTWQRLITAGADISCADRFHQLIIWNKLTHAEVLCKAGAPIHEMTIDHQSRTAIQVAAEYGNVDMLELLLRCGADVKSPAGFWSGATCLQLASGQGDIGIVRLLLHKGADVNGKRSLVFGRTAIEAAAENGRLDILKLLLLHQNDLSHTAADRYQFIRAAKLAAREGHSTIMRMLRQHIGWDDNDQRLFDEMRDKEEFRAHFDEMTQSPLDCQTSHPDLMSHVEEVIEVEWGLTGTIPDVVKRWLGPDINSQTQSWSGDSEQLRCPPAGLVTTQQEEASQKNPGLASAPEIEPFLQLGTSRSLELLPSCNGSQSASGDPDDLLCSKSFDDQLFGQFPDCVMDPMWQETGLQAPTPQLMRLSETPWWLQMQENDIDIHAIPQRPALHETTDGSIWGPPSQVPVTQYSSSELGMVLGEVLDETQLTGENALAGDDILVFGDKALEAAGGPGCSQQQLDSGFDGAQEKIVEEVQGYAGDDSLSLSLLQDDSEFNQALDSAAAVQGDPSEHVPRGDADYDFNEFLDFDVLGVNGEWDETQNFDWGCDWGFSMVLD